MLRITVELVPLGDEDNKQKIGEMVIANTGDTQSITSSYEAWISKNDWSGEPEMYGKLDDYNRSQSVWELIRLMLEAIRLEEHIPSKEKNSLAQRLKRKLL